MNGLIDGGQVYKLVDGNLLGATIKIHPSRDETCCGDVSQSLNLQSFELDDRSSDEIVISFEW